MKKKIMNGVMYVLSFVLSFCCLCEINKHTQTTKKNN